MIEICNGVRICEDELVFAFSRSSGPGGQNVNKVSSRVTLYFDVANTASLSDYQKRRIAAKLSSRINKDGVLRVVCQKFRTQAANRRLAVERLGELLTEAIARKTPRRKTKIPPSTKRKRLEDKKRRGETKKLRKPPVD